MQTHGGPAADAAITGRERRLTARLLVDWDRDGKFGNPLSDLSGFASTITTDRSLSGSAPAEITLIEGAAAAELTATLSGWHGGLSLVEVFAPYNGRSPFYGADIIGAEVRYAIDVHTTSGTVTYPQFVGVVRSLSPDRAEGTVELACLDRVELLRRPVRLPPWAISEHWAGRGRIRAQLCDSVAVIDHCLRHCDMSPTPYRPTYKPELGVGDDALDGVQMWLSGTGSHVPTVGWMDNATAQSFPATEATGEEMFALDGAVHPDSPAPDRRPLCLAGVSDGATLKYWCADRDLMLTGASHYLGATLITTATGWQTADTTLISARIGSQREYRLRLAAGRVWAELVYLPDGTVFASSRVVVPVDRDHVQVSAILDHTRQSGCRMFVNAGGTTTNGFEKVAAPYDGVILRDELAGLIVVTHHTPVADLCYATRAVYDTNTTLDSLWRPARYPAVLDPGRNRLSYLPVRSGVDAWDIVTEVAGAEFGSVFFDENGVFHFWNFDSMLARQADTVRTLTVDDLAGLSVRRSLDSVRNTWSVECGKRVGAYGTVYDSRSVDEFYVPPRTRKIVRLWVDDVQCADPFTIRRHTTVDGGGLPRWHDGVVGGYVVQWFIGGVWVERPAHVSGVDINCYWDVHGALVVNIYNGYPEPARLAISDDRAALRIPGTRVLDGAPQTITTTYPESIAAYGGRNLRLSGDWYQDGYQTTAMLDALAARTAKPVPVTEDITTPGDPRIQLGDTLAIHDPHGLGELLRAQILGIRRAFDTDHGLTDQLTVELLEPPGTTTPERTHRTPRSRHSDHNHPRPHEQP